MKISTTKRLERLTERYMNGGIDRRAFLGLAAAAGATAGLSMRWMPQAQSFAQKTSPHKKNTKLSSLKSKRPQRSDSATR